jgi:GWxTD domain-containing protein
MKNRMQRWLMAIGLAGLIGMDGVAAAQSGQDVTVRAFRFYRAEGNKTLVTAFVEVPYSLLQVSADSAQLKYGVLVTILDGAGTRLTDASWPGKASGELKQAGAAAVEILDFPVTSGTFKIAVEVTDSVSGKHFTGSTDVIAWNATPKTSDLLLSPSMRPIPVGDTTKPRPGERLWGNTMVTAATRLRLTPVRSRAFYLLEAYSEAGDSGAMTVRVADSTGRVLVTSKPQPIRVAPGGSVLKGQIDLAGLPEGTYTLTVKVNVGSRTEELSDKLVMANFEATMDKERERLAALRETDEGYFSLMNEAQLDDAEAPLYYIAPPEALGVWKTDLTIDAKKRFLAQFWSKRDPTPATARNEAREGFYREIDAVNQLYKESGRASRPGWKTDRGRVRISNGAPGEVLDRRTSLGKAPPYEVWRFTSGKERYYIFADRTGFGNYELIATNDLRENGRAGWAEMMGDQALQDISRFLNVDFFRSEGQGLNGADKLN